MQSKSCVYNENLRFLQGIGLRKLRIASTLDAEVKRKSEDIVNEELEYLEYLIYLLKRNHEKKCKKYEHGECNKITHSETRCKKCTVKTLVFVIEDLDRFKNMQVFQQLREVNNLLNDRYKPNGYKFIYAVGNILFAGEEPTSDNTTDGQNFADKNSIDIKTNYESSYKDNAAKFFDFILNITPVMDSSNSYEYFKENFPALVGEDGIADEDLFMLSQYVSTPRVLIDVAHDFQMMKNMRRTWDLMHSDEKLLYYSILKSTFHNFYKIIHDVFKDLELIAKYFNNKDLYAYFEEERESEFVKLFLLYVYENRAINNINKNTIAGIWATIKTENNLSDVMSKHGTHELKVDYHFNVKLSDILDFARKKSVEYIFSADAFVRKTGVNPSFDTLSFTKLISQYYESDNVLINKIIKLVETERYNDPNNANFSIKEFLDIDFVKQGIKDSLLDINDYNLYVTLDYLSVPDSGFLNDFNLNERKEDTFTRRLTDIDTIVSKMRIDKIQGSNGLNVHIIKYFQSENKNGPKVERINHNAINDSEFINLLLKFSFNKESNQILESVTIQDEFDRVKFLKANSQLLSDSDSFNKIIHWFDSHESYLPMGRGSELTYFLSSLNMTLKIYLAGTNYSAFMYSQLLGCDQTVKNEETLLHMLELILKDEDYRYLTNLVFRAYRNLIIDPDKIYHHTWLSIFNNFISILLPLLDSINTHVIQSIYEAQHMSNMIEMDEKIKIGFLKDITEYKVAEADEAFTKFLVSIYKYSIYEYNANNIMTLIKHFEDGTLTDYVPFVEYTMEHFEMLMYYRTENSLKHLDHKKPWISLLTLKTLQDSRINDLPERLQFFEEHDPFKLNVLSELALDNTRLKLLLGFVSLYSHTYENIGFVYDFLINEDPKVFNQIVASSSFDFAALYNDVILLNQNTDLSNLTRCAR